MRQRLVDYKFLRDAETIFSKKTLIVSLKMRKSNVEM